MEKPIRKIGNSQGLILTKQILESVGLSVGDLVQANVKNGKIILSPVRLS